MRQFLMAVVLAGLAMPGWAMAQENATRLQAGQGLAGIFSEIRLGAIWHDPNAKEDSFAVNGELRFTTPVPSDWVADIGTPYRWLLTPRPHLGFTANTGGKTSKGYFGLTWTAMLARDLFRTGDGIRFDFLFGGSVNDGKHDARLPDRKDLGGNLLFHVGGELGYQIDPVWSVSMFVDHDSNGGTAKRNQGLNSLGLRLGYML